MTAKRVLVARSGGVDSSVVAALLVEQGYEVIGCTMQVWDYSQSNCEIEEGNGTCCSSIDVDDARAVADHLQIPFYVLNCEEKFQEFVIDDFVDSYLHGKTPIPCVNCNTYLKFDHLLRKSKKLNGDYLATCHYAKVVWKNDKPTIMTSEDGWKDQTYFLFTLAPELLSRIMFPIGEWEKPKVREYAESIGLPVARKKDSTGICFIGKKGYKGFIEEHVEASQFRPGLLREWSTGKILGHHNGIHNFTYGQRKALGVPSKVPLYVVKIDSDNHTVWLGGERDLYQSEFRFKAENWLDEFHADEVLRVKIRFQHQGAEARIVKENDEVYRVNFLEPQRAITPGQAAVIYRDKQLVGGGWIQ